MTKEQLVELLKEDLKREWQHMEFYLSASSLVTGLHREEYKEFFFNAAQSEMTHVKEFQDLIIGLDGFLPKLDDSKNTLALYNMDDTGLSPYKAIELLARAHELETEVTKNYTERIQQAEELGGVDGKWVAVFLEDQLKHSREDADNIKQILRGI